MTFPSNTGPNIFDTCEKVRLFAIQQTYLQRTKKKMEVLILSFYFSSNFISY